MFALLCYIVFSYVLFFLVRDVETSQDYKNYLSWFISIANGGGGEGILSLKDPAFYMLSKLSVAFNGGVYFVIFSLVSIAIFSKAILLSRFDVIIILTFTLLYICKFFFTLELTQFRAAAAIGLSLLSLMYYSERKVALSGFAIILALTVHLSAILILLALPIIYLSRKAKYQKLILLSMMLLLLMAIATPIKLSFFVFIPLIGERLIPYLDSSYQVYELSLLNSYLFIKIIMYLMYVAWFFLKRDSKVINSDRNNLQLFFYLSCLGTFFFIAFRLNDAIALRLSEFYSVFDLLFFAFLSKVFSKEAKLYFRYLLLLLSSAFLYSSLNLIN